MCLDISANQNTNKKGKGNAANNSQVDANYQWRKITAVEERIANLGSPALVLEIIHHGKVLIQEMFRAHVSQCSRNIRATEYLDLSTKPRDCAHRQIQRGAQGAHASGSHILPHYPTYSTPINTVPTVV